MYARTSLTPNQEVSTPLMGDFCFNPATFHPNVKQNVNVVSSSPPFTIFYTAVFVCLDEHFQELPAHLDEG
jgi:hypothetical protein